MKKLTLKKFLTFSKMELLALKNLIKLIYTHNKTPLGETGCLSNLYYLLAAQAYSSLIPKHSQDTFDTLPLNVQYVCDLPDAMHRHWSPSTSHPTLPWEPENFPQDGKYPKNAPLPTFLAYMQLV